jgi:hypothetical protein
LPFTAEVVPSDITEFVGSVLLNLVEDVTRASVPSKTRFFVAPDTLL